MVLGSWGGTLVGDERAGGQGGPSTWPLAEFQSSGHWGPVGGVGQPLIWGLEFGEHWAGAKALGVSHVEMATVTSGTTSPPRETGQRERTGPCCAATLLWWPWRDNGGCRLLGAWAV